MRLVHVVTTLTVCVAFVACNGAGRRSGSGDDCSTITPENSDHCVRLNQIQLLGTHTSCHIAPEPAMLRALEARGRNLEYTHRPLSEQLSRLGIRQFGLDVYADPEGGWLAQPAAFRMVNGLEPLTADLSKPGFKVLHTQDVDYRTTCATLVACLRQISDWSRSNPRHLPIMVMLEAKEAALDDPTRAGFVTPSRYAPRSSVLSTKRSDPSSMAIA